MKAAQRRKRAMAKSKMNSRGENNGRPPTAQEIMLHPRDAAAAERCRWEVSSQIQLGCTISAETFGNGASTPIKEAPAQPAVIGVCCVAAHGRQGTVWKCNRPIASLSIA